MRIFATLSLCSFLVINTAQTHAQTKRMLEWNAAQEVTKRECNADEFSFVQAPEQKELEMSHNLEPQFADNGPYTWTCTALSSPAYNEATVLRVFRPNVYDDGVGFTLVHAKHSLNTYLIKLIGGDHEEWAFLDNENATAALNSILANGPKKPLEEIDWLTLSQAYLELIGVAPILRDEHYSPKTGETFKPYTVPGLLNRQKELHELHLMPTVDVQQDSASVVLHYRSESFMPMLAAFLSFKSKPDHLQLLDAIIQEHKIPRTRSSVTKHN